MSLLPIAPFSSTTASQSPGRVAKSFVAYVFRTGNRPFRLPTLGVPAGFRRRLPRLLRTDGRQQHRRRVSFLPPRAVSSSSSFLVQLGWLALTFTLGDGADGRQPATCACRRRFPSAPCSGGGGGRHMQYS